LIQESDPIEGTTHITIPEFETDPVATTYHEKGEEEKKGGEAIDAVGDAYHLLDEVPHSKESESLLGKPFPILVDGYINEQHVFDERPGELELVVRKHRWRWKHGEEEEDARCRFELDKDFFKDGLTSYEVNFSYYEAGENKQDLGKLVTCERCAEKLHYKRRNENELEGKQEQEENKRKRNPDIELVSERSGLDYRFPDRYVEHFLSQYSYDNELDLVVGKHKWRWKQVPEEKEGRLQRKKIFILLPTSCKFGYLLLGSWRIVSFFSPWIGVILLMSGEDSCVACCLLGYPLSVIMSGGTPIGVGYMRQRHSRGYASSGDDLEVDACSWSRPTSPASVRGWTWIQLLEDLLWLASAAFITYHGDWHSKLIHLLWHGGSLKILKESQNFGQFSQSSNVGGTQMMPGPLQQASQLLVAASQGGKGVAGQNPNQALVPVLTLTLAHMDERQRKVGENSGESLQELDPVEEDPGEFFMEEFPEISLNAIIGSRSPKTMRIIGILRYQRVDVLIDSSSTHNLVGVEIVPLLGLQPVQHKGVEVRVANGQLMPSLGRCQAVTLKLQDFSFSTETREQGRTWNKASRFSCRRTWKPPWCLASCYVAVEDLIPLTEIFPNGFSLSFLLRVKEVDEMATREASLLKIKSSKESNS
jgi:hypothetical protein